MKRLLDEILTLMGYDEKKIAESANRWLSTIFSFTNDFIREEEG